MHDQQGRGDRWSIWMAAIGISLVALIGEIFYTPLSPLVGPHVCAAALATKLPSRQFVLLVGLLACAIGLPILSEAGVADELAHRSIGLACLGVIAAVHLFGARRATWRKEQQPVPPVSPPRPSSPSTQIRGTDHRSPGKGKSTDPRVEAGSETDHIAPALKRLESGGMFSHEQLGLIEAEMRSIESPKVSVHHHSTPLEHGVRIGRFIVDQPLGRGGEGHVYRGHDENGEPAAIKILHNMRVGDRFRREMHLVRQLAHPNIVTAYEVGEYKGLPFITMELLTGPDLNVLVRESGPLSWQLSTQHILQAARALAHAHRRDLVHRDIKPGNLILNGDNVVKLVDLGLAAVSGNDAGLDSVFQYETQEGHLAGTLPYMAPEQARSLANATVRSDIYGLGATWYFLLTGKERLRGKTFSKQFENLLVRRRFNALPDECMPQALQEIYHRMVAYKVDDRYGCCDELADEIEQAFETVGETVCAVEGIDVLVVEDSRTDMIFTIEMLRRSNSTLSIHQAKTLADGIDICRQMSIDLVLLDLSLPDSTGVETVIRFREAMQSVPLVILTGMTKDEVGAECMAAGADSFISKNGLTPHRMERTIFVTLSRCGMTRNASSEAE